MFAKKVDGREGEIRIDSIGATIGQMNRWTLHRESVNDASTGYFTFRAQMRYINQALFDDPDYVATVYIVTHRDKQTRKAAQYRLEQAEGRKTEIRGTSLLMEGVKVCPPRES
jgi:hypothetical protein